jgi:hypothetical protein
MYLILDPENYDRVRTVKVVGEVRIARSRPEVEGFYRKYGRLYGSLVEWSAEAIQAWVEVLGRPNLE